MAKILNTKPIEGNSPNEWIGWSYLTTNADGLRVIVHVEPHGSAEDSSDPNVRKLLTDAGRAEVVKRVSDEARRPGEIRVFVREVPVNDSRLIVEPGTAVRFPRFEPN